MILIKYVPGATTAHPGIKIDVTKSGVANLFPGFIFSILMYFMLFLTLFYTDQFLPFRKFGPNMKTFYDGTFFRFPLRSQTTAKDSEIKKQVVRY